MVSLCYISRLDALGFAIAGFLQALTEPSHHGRVPVRPPGVEKRITLGCRALARAATPPRRLMPSMGSLLVQT